MEKSWYVFWISVETLPVVYDVCMYQVDSNLTGLMYMRIWVFTGMGMNMFFVGFTIHWLIELIPLVNLSTEWRWHRTLVTIAGTRKYYSFLPPKYFFSNRRFALLFKHQDPDSIGILVQHLGLSLMVPYSI